MAYNYTYADMMLTVGGKLLLAIVVLLILFFGNDTAVFENANAVRKFWQETGSMAKQAKELTPTK